MKKVVSFILAVVLCLGLCACTQTSSDSTGSNVSGGKDPYADVKSELVGSWKGKIDAQFYSDDYDEENFYTAVIFIFKNDGSVRAHAQLCHKSVGTVDTKEYLGTFDVQNGKIVLNYTSTYRIVDSVVRDETSYSGSDTLQYTFQNGALSVSINEVELEKDQ